MSTDLKRILEALLFAAEAPLSLAQLAQVLETDDKKVLTTALDELAKEYDFLERAFALVEVAGGWRLRTRPEMSFWLRKLKRQSVTRLSRAALETLAIIAYKQPVLKAEIERIRGVEVSGVLKMLLERDLVRSVGRRDLPGRPLIYGTTKRFLEVFDLKDLNELPTLDEMENLLGESDADQFADQGDLFESKEDGDGPASLEDLDLDGEPDEDQGDEPDGDSQPGEDGEPGDEDQAGEGGPEETREEPEPGEGDSPRPAVDHEPQTSTEPGAEEPESASDDGEEAPEPPSQPVEEPTREPRDQGLAPAELPQEASADQTPPLDEADGADEPPSDDTPPDPDQGPRAA